MGEEWYKVREDYLSSVRRVSASYLIMDKQTPHTVWSDITVPENQ